MTVPPPLGFSTFLMRIGIFLRMTYEPMSSRPKSEHADRTYLVHRERVDNLAPVVGQFSRLFWGNNRNQSSSRDLPWVCSEDSINLLPNLQLGGTKPGGQQCCKKVGVATSNLSK